MKIAVFVMSIMVMCICPGRISEEKDLVLREQRRPKDCRSPKGKHGTVRTDGCIQSTCTNGKWKPKMRTDICCYKQQVHEPNTVLDTIVGADNCSSTTIGCGAVGQLEFNQNTCTDPATKQQVAKLEINLEQQIKKKSDEILITVKEVDKKIKEMNKSIENNVDDLKNTTLRQSEDLSDKVHVAAQKIENNKKIIENHVNDISRKLETQTEKMKQTAEKLERKIQNLNQTFENKVDDMSDQFSKKLEKQTEQIQESTKNQAEKIEELTKTQTEKIEELTKNQAEKMEDLKNKLDNQTHKIQTLENNVQEKLETQTEKIEELTKSQAEKIEDLTNNMESLTQMVKDNIGDQAEMSLQMMRTLTNLTQLMVKHSDDTPMVEGVLITGGSGALTTTELFLPHTGKTCILQPLPDNRYHHSLDVVSDKIILCGGGYSRTSCLQFLTTSSTGSWAYYATLAQGRYYHTTHSFQEDLLLMGGDSSKGTTEIIGQGTQYNLQQETRYACSIPDGSSTILTGGYSGSANIKTVARYNMKGFVVNLPDLATARRGHGCGSYVNTTGNTKVLVVAGGYGSGYLSSTELLVSGATAWTSGDSLPRTLGWPGSVNMGSYFLLIGGYGTGTRGEILKFDGTWTEVGMMNPARSGARATKIELTGGFLNITGCY